MAGATIPTEFEGRKLKPIAGKSLLPIFKGKKREPHNAIYWQYSKSKAMRDGKWKIVKYADQDWELYDMNKDRTELHNLAVKYPKRVGKMTARWNAWHKRVRKKG